MMKSGMRTEMLAKGKCNGLRLFSLESILIVIIRTNVRELVLVAALFHAVVLGVLLYNPSMHPT